MLGLYRVRPEIIPAARYTLASNGATIVWSSQLNAVNDGTASDLDATSTTTSLSANWSINNATDVDHYDYAFGTTPGGVDIVGYTGNGLTTAVTRNGLVPHFRDHVLRDCPGVECHQRHYLRSVERWPVGRYCGAGYLRTRRSRPSQHGHNFLDHQRGRQFTS